jgi:TonB-dependent receptor-like protein
VGCPAGRHSGGSYNDLHPGDNYTQRASLSYVTGSHAFKTGVQTLQGVYDIAGNALPNGVNYIFRNGAPLLVRQFASPFYNNVRVRSLGLFAQDQWTIHRLTLNLGVRYDHFESFAKAITLPAGPFIGERHYPEVRDIPNYNDITPRLGVAKSSAQPASWCESRKVSAVSACSSPSSAEGARASRRGEWSRVFVDDSERFSPSIARTTGPRSTAVLPLRSRR